MQSVHITTKVVSLNPAHDEVYSITTLCISFSVSSGMSAVSCGILVFSINKIDRQDTTEVLLKVALNTITLTLTINSQFESKFNIQTYTVSMKWKFNNLVFFFFVFEPINFQGIGSVLPIGKIYLLHSYIVFQQLILDPVLLVDNIYLIDFLLMKESHTHYDDM